MSTKPSAKVIADSISESGDRLTTLQVVGHRNILAEFNTHRKFSRNSASSRAIPVEKQLERIKTDPALPIEWRAEQSGMQSGGQLAEVDAYDAHALWTRTLDATVHEVETYLNRHPEKGNRLHKSWINRLLEPWMWHTICVSSTEWENFFAQRCSPLAQPEIQAVAYAMRDALAESDPVPTEGGWHMPYITNDDMAECYERGIDPRQVSVARCARTSYLTQEGTRDLAKDVELYERLENPGEGPPHMSPFEHVASPSATPQQGNFDGWLQLRHVVFS